MNEERFRILLERHLTARMAQEKLSYGDVARAIGLSGRNYTWRLGHPECPKEYKIKGPENLTKIIAWLDLEPRDFSQEDTPALPGHLIDVILRLQGISLQQRRQLVDVANAFLQAAIKE